MKICMIGTGYVGLVAGTCFADSGNEVVCVDIDAAKIDELRQGRVPIFEPGLEELVRRNVQESRLDFTTDLDAAVSTAEIIFIAVGTPQDEDGSSDLRHVLQAAQDIARAMQGPAIIVNKSTVPVGTTEQIRKEIAALTNHPFQVVSNPEFLKEGRAIEDFTLPDRIVIGASNKEAIATMRRLYAPFTRTRSPILVMDTRSAEMTKYAANAMLACRISFMNEIANLCESVGADVERVRTAIGSDSRIGRSFLFPGVGYGGSCFPKDIKALIRIGKNERRPMDLAEAVDKVNERQKHILVDKIERYYESPAPARLKQILQEAQGGPDERRLREVHRLVPTSASSNKEAGSCDLSQRTFAVWGLSFKPRTDDMREAPSRTIVAGLLRRGAQIRAYDPAAMNEARRHFVGSIQFAPSHYEALRDADALVLITEWDVFRTPDFGRMKSLMKSPVIFDGRNQYKPQEMAESGFLYFGIGRSWT